MAIPSPVSCAALVLVTVFPMVLLAQTPQSDCRSVATDRNWHAYRSIRIDSNTTSYEAAWPELPPSFEAASLVGTFVMKVVVTNSPRSDSLALGRMSLWVTPKRYQSVQPAKIIGATDLDFATFGHLNTGYSPAARDALQPGVQFVQIGRRAVFVLGAATTHQNRWKDAGLMFYLFEVDSSGFRGRWREGSPSSNPAQGYFCAKRITAP